MARFLAAIVKRQYRMIVLGLILGVVSFLVIPQVFKIIPPPKRTLKTGLIGQPSLGELPERVLNDISFGLTKPNQSGEPQPALAKNWSVAEGGKNFTFTLATNPIVWHDGRKFIPEDINYNLKEIDFIIEDNQISFTLKEPFAPFPVFLSKPLFKKGLVGLGDYQVQKIERRGSSVKSIYLTSKKSDLPHKMYRFYNNEKELKTAFNLGEINYLDNLLDLNGLYLSASVGVEERLMEEVYLGVFFNTSNAPFSSKTFRQALAYATPKEPGRKRALGPISSYSWTYNPDVKPYNLDLKHAKQLLEKEKPKDGLKKITITTFPQYEILANEIRDSWQKIGLEVGVQLTTFLPEEYEVLLIAREIPPDPDQYYFWHSTQAGNITNFKSPRIDKLLEDGRRTIDKEERKDIYFDFQRFLVEESPVIFLTHPQSYIVTRK